MLLAVLLTLAVALSGTLPSRTRQAQAQPADGTAAWRLGGPGLDEPRDLGADRDGNTYVLGVFSDTLDADPGPEERLLTSNGGSDVFLVKYAPDGSVLWAWSIGGPGQDEGYALAMAPDGGVFIAGGFVGAVDFEPGEGDAGIDSGSERQGFIARYGADGVLAWVAPLGLAGDDAIMSLALDAGGNVVAAGLSRLSTVPGQPFPVSHGDLFALRLDGDGRLLWSAVLPTQTVGVQPVAVAVTPAGEMLVAGAYTGTVRVALGAGLVNATSAGGSDILLLKLTPAGGLIWARSIGGPADDAPGPKGLAVDADGNVALVGTFGGVVDLNADGAFLLESQGLSDILAASLDAGGVLRWASSLGGPGPDGGVGVAVDGARYVYLTGWFTGTISPPAGQRGGPLSAQGQGGASDALVAKLTPSGQPAWMRGFGGRVTGAERSSTAMATVVGPQGDIRLAGRFFGADVDFDPGPSALTLSSEGQSDLFVVDLGADGLSRRMP
ncbi:MAG: hypothetical protein IT306_11165 [Chloroflexi bacterium]|nr:hypothetical protein [Chloroflexota bacterium]